MRTRSPRLPVLVVLVGLAATACVSKGKPGVSIDSVEANVVFGLPKSDVVVPANVDAGGLSAASGQGGFNFTSGDRSIDRLPSLSSSERVKAECPTAPPTAAADKPADATISGKVREGTYVWKRIGTQSKADPKEGEPSQVAIRGFEKRVVRNVKKVSNQLDPDAYSFEMVQTLIDRPVIQVRTFLVKPHTSAQATPGGVPAVDEPRANEPEGGVSLIKVENFDAKGSSLGTFQPTKGLLYLGLPVDPSETFKSSATDPKSGQTIVQDSVVRGRKRIDACGDLVDGWRVETKQTRSDSTETVAYNFLIATQYGGVPILEEIHTTAADGSTFDVTFSLGQLNPGPIS